MIPKREFIICRFQIIFVESRSGWRLRRARRCHKQGCSNRRRASLLSIIALNSACELVNQPGFDSDVIFGEAQTRRRIESASVLEKANGREADYSLKWMEARIPFLEIGRQGAAKKDSG